MTVTVLAASAATVLAAAATTWMAVSTRKLARATQASVKTAEQAFEREKDGLLPVLQLDWALADETDSRGGHPFRLSLKNVGPGPAFVREITVRNEVNRPAVYRSRLHHALIPPGHGARDLLEREPGYALEGPRLSSVSVWYQDVYDRWYRSRLLFRYERTEQDPVAKVEPLFVERESLTSSPSYAWNTVRDPQPPNYVGLAECGRCIPWNPVQVGEEWHTLQALAQARSVKLPGQAVCGQRLLAVKDMGFWLDTAWPQFTVEVNGHRPWVLAVRSIGLREPSAQDIMVLTTAEFPRGWTASLPAPLPSGLPDLDWEQFGLVLGPGAPQQLWALYQTIWHAVEARIAGPPSLGPM